MKQFANTIRTLPLDCVADITGTSIERVRKHLKPSSKGTVPVTDAIRYAMARKRSATCRLIVRLPLAVIVEAKRDADLLRYHQPGKYMNAVARFTLRAIVNTELLQHSQPAKIPGGHKIDVDGFNDDYDDAVDLLAMACKCSRSDVVCWMLGLFLEN